MAPAPACPTCGAELATPLLCERCGTLLDPPVAPTPFAVLGLAPSYALDLAAVRKRVLALSRLLHPDFHGNASAETRARAERNTAELNAAFQVLADDFKRADWLVRTLGGPREEEERAMPPAFLQEVLEWNETIEEARTAAPDAPARKALAGLAADIGRERAQAMQRVAAHLTPLPTARAAVLRAVRHELNAVRYLDRALREIGELQLAAHA